MRVAIVGPTRDGTMRIHRAGCADVKREARRWDDARPWTIEAATRREVASAIYGPEAGSYFEESGGVERWDSLDRYLDDLISTRYVDFAPCVRDLPTTPAELATRAAVYAMDVLDGGVDAGEGAIEARGGRVGPMPESVREVLETANRASEEMDRTGATLGDVLDRMMGGPCHHTGGATMKRRGTTASSGSGTKVSPSLLARVNGDPERRAFGVAQAVSLAIGTVTPDQLVEVMRQRADTRPGADPTKAVLDFTYAVAGLAYPEEGWKPAALAGAKAAAKRARESGLISSAQQATAMAAGEELALAFLLHDRLPKGAYLSLVSPWVPAFPGVTDVEGVGTDPFTEEQITMATTTKTTRKPAAKPAATKPAARTTAKPKPVASAKPVERGAVASTNPRTRREWTASQRWWPHVTKAGDHCLAYERADGSLHAPGGRFKTPREALEEAKRKGWTVFKSREEATGKPAPTNGAKPAPKPAAKATAKPAARKATPPASAGKPAAIVEDAKVEGGKRRAAKSTTTAPTASTPRRGRPVPTPTPPAKIEAEAKVEEAATPAAPAEPVPAGEGA